MSAYLFIQKLISPLKIIFRPKSEFTSNCSRALKANAQSSLLSFAIRSWVNWILYGCRPKLRWKIGQLENCKRTSSLAKGINCLGLSCTLPFTADMFSADLAFWRSAIVARLLSEPVDLNFSTKGRIVVKVTYPTDYSSNWALILIEKFNDLHAFAITSKFDSCSFTNMVAIYCQTSSVSTAQPYTYIDSDSWYILISDKF